MGRKNLTKHDISEWLIADGRGITIIGDYINNSTKTLFGCQHGHEWLAEPRCIKSGNGCPICSGCHRPDTTEFNEWLKSDGRGIVLLGEYTNTKTKTLFRCSYSHEWLTEPDGIKKGRGCPICFPSGFNPDKPAWEYAFTRSGYLKYGITNSLPRRLAEHRRHGEFVLVHERYHESGQIALEWENSIKRTYGGRFVDKEQCPDGYTETLPIILAESISF